MTFVSLNKSNFDNLKIKVFPQQNYISGSSLALNTDIGEFGCIPAIRTRSRSIKEIDNLANRQMNSLFYYAVENAIKSGPTNNKNNNHGFLYLNNFYGDISRSQSDNYYFKVHRNTIEYRNPENSKNKNNINLPVDKKNDTFYRKILIKNSLYNKYKKLSTNSERYNYGFCNYNAINFFTLGVHPSYTADATVEKKSHKTCLIYPNPGGNTYTPDTMKDASSEYTISFWINPRRSNVNGYAYNPGTILHIPGLIGIYLVKGTSLDEFGHTDKFRILIETASDSYSMPSSAMLSNVNATVAASNLSVITDDNILEKNNWYHLTITFKNKLLKLFIDGVSVLEKVENIEKFIAPALAINLSQTIYIGNRHNYNTKAQWVANDTNLYNYYFGSDAAETYSSYDNGTTSGRSNAIIAFGGSLPDFTDSLGTTSSDSTALNAEISDFRIYSTSRLEDQAILDMKSYINSLTNELHLDLLFYLPVYFVPEKRTREAFVTCGDKMLLSIDGPINPYFSHRMLGHEVSVEHFLNEFVKKYRPFINGIHLPEAGLSTTSLNTIASSLKPSSRRINEAFLSDDTTKNFRQDNLLIRNYLIVPNDNGITYPAWSLIEEVYTDAKNFTFTKDIFNNYVKGLVSLNEIFDIKLNTLKDGDHVSQGVSVNNFENGSLYRKNRIPYSESDKKENINFSNVENINVDNLNENAIEDLLTSRIGLINSPH